MLGLTLLLHIALNSGVRLFRVSPELFVLACFLLPPLIAAAPALWWGFTAYFVSAVIAFIAWATVIMFRIER